MLTDDFAESQWARLTWDDLRSVSPADLGSLTVAQLEAVRHHVERMSDEQLAGLTRAQHDALDTADAAGASAVARRKAAARRGR